MNLGLPVAETVARTREAIARLRLESLIERDPQRLSGGQAQLVGIAALLAMRPRHVILDEPTAQLDPAGTRLVGEALRALAEAGTSLLIAEHKTDLLDGLCSRILVIDGGRIVMDGPTATVFDDPRLHELGVEPPARARLGRALIERGVAPASVERRPGAGTRRMTADTMLETQALVHVYPGGTRAVDGVDLVIRPRRAGRDHRPERLGQDDARPPFQRAAPTDRGPGARRRRRRRGQAGGRPRRVGRARLPGPGPPDLRGPGPGRGRLRSAEPRAGGADLERAVDERAGRDRACDGEAATNPYDLGYSRRKLLALASVLAMNTPVVVLDEPTTGQDARGVARIQRVVAGLSEAGRTVIAVSHDMRFVAETFERVVVMGSGRILLDGTPGRGLRRARLADPRLDLPRAAARRAGRGPAGARLHADRGRPRGDAAESIVGYPADLMTRPGRANGGLAALAVAALTVPVLLGACSPATPTPVADGPTQRHGGRRDAVRRSHRCQPRPLADAGAGRRRAGRLERLRARLPVRRDPRAGGLRGAVEGLPERLDRRAARDRSQEPDRVADRQSGRSGRVGRRVRPRRGGRGRLPEDAARAFRHRRLRSARRELQHGRSVHRQPRRARPDRPVTRQRRRAQGAGRRRPQPTPRPAPGATRRCCRTCRPTRSLATSTRFARRSATSRSPTSGSRTGR